MLDPYSRPRLSWKMPTASTNPRVLAGDAQRVVVDPHRPRPNKSPISAPVVAPNSQSTPGDADARDEVEVEITERGNRIEIRTRYPRNSRGRVSVEFDIQVPGDLGVSAKSVSGDIVLDGIMRRTQSVSGDVDACVTTMR